MRQTKWTYLTVDSTTSTSFEIVGNTSGGVIADSWGSGNSFWAALISLEVGMHDNAAEASFRCGLITDPTGTPTFYPQTPTFDHRPPSDNAYTTASPTNDTGRWRSYVRMFRFAADPFGNSTDNNNFGVGVEFKTSNSADLAYVRNLHIVCFKLGANDIWLNESSVFGVSSSGSGIDVYGDSYTFYPNQSPYSLNPGAYLAIAECSRTHTNNNRSACRVRFRPAGSDTGAVVLGHGEDTFQTNALTIGQNGMGFVNLDDSDDEIVFEIGNDNAGGTVTLETAAALLIDIGRPQDWSSSAIDVQTHNNVSIAIVSATTSRLYLPSDHPLTIGDFFYLNPGVSGTVVGSLDRAGMTGVFQVDATGSQGGTLFIDFSTPAGSGYSGSFTYISNTTDAIVRTIRPLVATREEEVTTTAQSFVSYDTLDWNDDSLDNFFWLLGFTATSSFAGTGGSGGTRVVLRNTPSGGSVDQLCNASGVITDTTNQQLTSTGFAFRYGGSVANELEIGWESYNTNQARLHDSSIFAIPFFFPGNTVWRYDGSDWNVTGVLKHSTDWETLEWAKVYLHDGTDWDN